MFRSANKWIWFVILVLSWIGPVQAQESIWVFEGLITSADTKLAPDLQSGWVLSGSFTFTAIELEEELPSRDNHSGRFTGGITDAELTVDLYHQLHFEAVQVPGLAGFDYMDNDPENEGRDLYGWFFPMRGKLKESGWSSRWLQIWLSDPEGNMIRSVPPAISPYGLKPESAWFRLTMENTEGETAFVDGTIEYFGPLSDRDEESVEESWRGVAADLSARLVERDQTISTLREELAAAIARVNSLRQMVDLMVEERNRLEEENRLLEEKARKTDPEVESVIAELQADKALLQDELTSLEERNHALADSLAESEYSLRKLQRELENAERLRGEAAEDPGKPAENQISVPVKSSEGKDVGVMTIIEQPMVVEKPVPVYIEKPVVQPDQSMEIIRESSDSSEDRSPRRTHRIGPRKFR